MPRSKAEIEVDLERLNAELADAVDDVEEVIEEHEDVIEEAAEATEDAIEDAVEEVVEDVVEAVEEAAEEAAEDAPLIDEPEDAEAIVASRVIAELEQRYELTPRVAMVEEHHETIMHDEPAPESAPESSHWSRRKIF